MAKRNSPEPTTPVTLSSVDELELADADEHEAGIGSPAVTTTSPATSVRIVRRPMICSRIEASRRSPSGPIVTPTSVCTRSAAARRSSSTHGHVRNASSTVGVGPRRDDAAAHADEAHRNAFVRRAARAKHRAGREPRRRRIDHRCRDVDRAREDVREREAADLLALGERAHLRGRGEGGARIVGQVGERLDGVEIELRGSAARSFDLRGRFDGARVLRLDARLRSASARARRNRSRWRRRSGSAAPRCAGCDGAGASVGCALGAARFAASIGRAAARAAPSPASGSAAPA